MVQRTYYPDREPTFAEKPPPERPFADPDVIRYGYRLADLDQIARRAAATDRYLAMSVADRRDVAWSAIVEFLLVAPNPPRSRELLFEGVEAIQREVRSAWQSQGWDRDQWRVRPGFLIYWDPPAREPFSDRLVEGIATRQIMESLPEHERDAINALALTDDYAAAAQSLGIRYKTLVARINSARKRLRGLWHEGETPRQENRHDRRRRPDSALPTHCPQGHPWDEENTQWEQRMRNGRPIKYRRCRSCVRARSNKAGAA